MSVAYSIRVARNLHPLNYTLGLARAALGKGARIFCHARAKSLKKSGGSLVVETEAGQVRARRVLVCTNAETDGLFPALARMIVPIRSVQVATAPLPEDIRRIVLPGRHAVADSRRVMIYYKMDRAGRLLMGGRGDHSDATTRKLLENLRRIARRLFPQIGNVPFEYAWGGHVAMTADHYPHVAALGDDILSVVGFNGRGLALGTAMGRVLADWAAGTPKSELDFPVTPLRQIRLHALHRPAARAAVLLFRLRDALGI